MDNVIQFPTYTSTVPEQHQLVFDFFDAFEVPRNGESRDLYERLIHEESKEVAEAAAHLLKELSDLRYVITAFINLEGDPMAAVDIACTYVDEDLLNDLIEAYDEVDWEAYRIVHSSNMSKLGEDGKPVRREDGKVLKGPFYQPADLSALIAPIQP